MIGVCYIKSIFHSQILRFFLSFSNVCFALLLMLNVSEMIIVCLLSIKNNNIQWEDNCNISQCRTWSMNIIQEQSKFEVIK